MRTRRYIVFISVIMFLCSFINISCASKEGPAINKTAADFTLEDTNGNNVNLKEMLAANKAVLLVFWASWCPYCIKEMPELIKLDADYKEKGLKILGINVGEKKAKVKSAMSKKRVTYTVLLDKDNKVAGQYNVMGLPTNILLDKTGAVKYRGTSPPSRNLLP